MVKKTITLDSKKIVKEAKKMCTFCKGETYGVCAR